MGSESIFITPKPSAGRESINSNSLYDMGVVATIGKGVRSADVCSAVKRNKTLYLCAIGGAGALAAKSITDCTVIAFDELGCESVKKIEFSDFPLVVAVDAHGNNLFDL